MRGTREGSGCAAIAVALCVLTACGSGESNDPTPPISSIAPSVGSALQSAQKSVEEKFDDAKLVVFVTAFRARYAHLAEGRNDESIEHIAIESCIDIARGADEQAVTEQIVSLAENGSTRPSREQADRIYDLVRLTCP